MPKTEQQPEKQVLDFPKIIDVLQLSCSNDFADKFTLAKWLKKSPDIERKLRLLNSEFKELFEALSSSNQKKFINALDISSSQYIHPFLELVTTEPFDNIFNFYKKHSQSLNDIAKAYKAYNKNIEPALNYQPHKKPSKAKLSEDSSSPGIHTLSRTKSEHQFTSFKVSKFGGEHASSPELLKPTPQYPVPKYGQLQPKSTKARRKRSEFGTIQFEITKVDSTTHFATRPPIPSSKSGHIVIERKGDSFYSLTRVEGELKALSLKTQKP